MAAENNDMSFFQLFQYCLGSGLGIIGDFSSEQLQHDPPYPPPQGFDHDPVGLALKVTVLPDKVSKSSEDQIARETGRRQVTHLTLCVTAFLASCDFQACVLCSLYDTCEKYQIPC